MLGQRKAGSSIRRCLFFCDLVFVCAYLLSPTRPWSVHPIDLAYMSPPLRSLPGSSRWRQPLPPLPLRAFSSNATHEFISPCVDVSLLG